MTPARLNDRSTPSPIGRLLSLDVFRGLTIAGMILVNSPGSDVAYAPLDHSAWNGLTPTDLVFPFFVFIVGVALGYSFQKRMDQGTPRGALLLQAFQRAAIIFFIGLLLNGFPHYHLSTIRILGVLQRIAICSFAASFFFLYTRVSAHIVTIVTVLVGYWALMLYANVPGYGAGILTKEGNLAAYIDRLVLGVHMYRPAYDPEGLLSTLPAIATALLGNLTGEWLRSTWTAPQKVTGMLQASMVFMLLGFKGDSIFPINKALWSSSFVLATVGLALVLLATCYWLIEIHKWTAWSKPFEIFGRNAILAYVLHVLFLKVQNLWVMPRLDGTPGNIRIYVTQHLFQPWMSPLNASLAYALAYVGLWLAVLTVLYRKKIFLKV